MGDPDKASAIAGFLKQINDTVMHFGIVDIILVILVLIGLLRGYRKGFSVVLGNLLHIIFVIVITFEYMEPLASIFKTESPVFTAMIRALTFFAIVIVCYYVAKVILQGLAKILTLQFTEVIDKVAGAFTGIAFFILLLSFTVNFVLMFSTKGLKKTYEEANMSGIFLENVAPSIHEGVHHLALRIAGKATDKATRSTSTGKASMSKPQVVYGQ